MANNYLVGGRQLLTSTLIIACLVSLCTVFVMMLLNYLDLPEVHVNGENKCVKVVNYKNGDGYGCPDRDVTLRKYKVVHTAAD